MGNCLWRVGRLRTTGRPCSLLVVVFLPREMQRDRTKIWQQIGRDRIEIALVGHYTLLQQPPILAAQRPAQQLGSGLPVTKKKERKMQKNKQKNYKKRRMRTRTGLSPS